MTAIVVQKQGNGLIARILSEDGNRLHETKARYYGAQANGVCLIHRPDAGGKLPMTAQLGLNLLVQLAELQNAMIALGGFDDRFKDAWEDLSTLNSACLDFIKDHLPGIANQEMVEQVVATAGLKCR